MPVSHVMWIPYIPHDNIFSSLMDKSRETEIERDRVIRGNEKEKKERIYFVSNEIRIHSMGI
jgi:soluble P-type ATPase